MIIVRFASALLRKRGDLTSRKHGIECGDIVVEEVEKKQCCKYRGHKVLEIFGGDTVLLLVMDALLIRNNGRVIARKKLGAVTEIW